MSYSRVIGIRTGLVIGDFKDGIRTRLLFVRVVRHNASREHNTETRNMQIFVKTRESSRHHYPRPATRPVSSSPRV